MFRQEVTIPSTAGITHITYSAENLRNQREKHGDNVKSVIVATLAWTAMLADSPLGGYKPRSSIRRFFYALCKEYLETSNHLSDLADAIIHSSHRTESGSIAEFLPLMQKTPVFREYLHWYKTGDAACLAYCLSFLNFGGKIKYKDDSLKATALREWFEDEERIAKDHNPSWIGNLKLVISALGVSGQLDHWLPVHGSGSVAEKGVWGAGLKCYHFYTTDVLDEFLTEFNPDVGTALPPATRQESIVHNHAKARLAFVPKNMKKMRSIGMEPIPLMWAQQGARLWYETELSKTAIGNHYDPHDQTKSQRAAKFGSDTGLTDTIDLKSASNSVRADLVDTVFNEYLRNLFASTRSTVVELPDGSIFEPTKFAPMGSALCFPVQSTIYTAITLMVGLAARMNKDWRTAGIFEGFDLNFLYERAFTRSYRRNTRIAPTVYGDDIVCDHRDTDDIIAALKELSFVVNTEKSFTGTASYRESCGKHYFLGSDVTPIRLALPTLKGRLDAEAIASIIDNANLCYERGYTHTRRVLVRCAMHTPINGVKKVGLNPIAFTTDPDESLALLSTNPRNSHLAVRQYGDPKSPTRGSHIDYQRKEHKRVVLETDDEVWSPEMDSYYHVVWWRSRYSGVETDAIKRQPEYTDTRGARARLRWTAAGE